MDSLRVCGRRSSFHATGYFSLVGIRKSPVNTAVSRSRPLGALCSLTHSVLYSLYSGLERCEEAVLAG